MSGSQSGSLVGAVVGMAVVVAAGCFVIGALSPATWIAKAFGKDVRGLGSGNPGATNVGRVLGVKWGVLVGVLDVAKGFVPCWFLLRQAGATFAAIGGVCVVLGHVFSPFLKGRGGKGVATTLGVILALAPWLALCALVVFAVAVPLLKRMGEAAVVAAVFLGVSGAVIAVGVMTFGGRPPAVGVCVALLSVLVLARHHGNIQRAWARLTKR